MIKITDKERLLKTCIELLGPMDDPELAQYRNDSIEQVITTMMGEEFQEVFRALNDIEEFIETSRIYPPAAAFAMLILADKIIRLENHIIEETKEGTPMDPKDLLEQVVPYSMVWMTQKAMNRDDAQSK